MNFSIEDADQSEQAERVIDTQICVVGAGPGGALLSLLLAQKGINVTLIEKAKNFERNFRGESVSPDARALLEKSGLEDCFAQYGSVKYSTMDLYENNKKILQFDLSHSNNKYNFVTEFPQPILLKTLVEKAKAYPNFTFIDGTTPTELVKSDSTVTGLIAKNKEEKFHIRSQLVVAADGRFSFMRKLANVSSTAHKTARDVLWFVLPRPENWKLGVRIKVVESRQVIILPTYPNKLRCGVNIPPGGFSKIKEKGIEALWKTISELEPLLSESVREHIRSFDDVQLLNIFTGDISQWAFDGLIFIGDAAHTMSPVMGQGIKLSLFDGFELSKVITQRLTQKPSGVFKEAELKSFESNRKEEIKFIAEFQKKQERLFSMQTPFQTMKRRAIYRTINALPFIKNRNIQRIYMTGLKTLPAPR